MAALQPFSTKSSASREVGVGCRTTDLKESGCFVFLRGDAAAAVDGLPLPVIEILVYTIAISKVAKISMVPALN